MSPVTVINNEYATLVYQPEQKIVHHTFHKPMTSTDFRQVLNTGAELFAKHQACKWLSDDRGNGALSPEDSEWAMQDWFPRVLKSGWKFWALVVPEDIMARMNLTQFVNSYYDQGLRIMVFTDPKEATEWLERQ
jgi:hypothetical protein